MPRSVLRLPATTAAEWEAAARMLAHLVREGVTFTADMTADSCEMVITFTGGF